MYYKKLSILLFETKQNDLMNLVSEQTSAVDLLTNLLSDLGDDEKKEIYHVGTSSGRSDFSGLSRINNTTTAVTTAISAYDGLIAEQ